MVKQGTRVLVTGGAGFLGSHVTRALVATGCQVRVLDDLSSGKRERLAGCNVDLMHADVRNPATIARAVRGSGAIIHLASVQTSDDPLRAQEVNMGGTLNLLNAVRAIDKSQRPRVVLCSSGAVYGKQNAFVLHEELPAHPAVPHAVMSLAAENYGRVYREAYGVPTACLRLFRVFGPDEDAGRPDASVVARFIRAALDGTSPVIHGDGQQTRDLLYVDNAVQAILAALSLDSAEPINIGSGEAVAMNFLWTQVLELLGKKRMAIEPTYIPALPWEPKHLRPQIARASKALGWAPTVRLREGLTRTVQHFQSSRSGDPNAWFTPKTSGREPTPPPVPRPRIVTPSQPRIAVTTPSQPRIVTPSQPRIAMTTPSQPRIAVPPPPPPQALRPARPPVRPAPERANLRRPATPPPAPAAASEVDDLDIEWAPVPAFPEFGR